MAAVLQHATLPGENQVDATRRILRESGMNIGTLATIEAADNEIDPQIGRK